MKQNRIGLFLICLLLASCKQDEDIALLSSATQLMPLKTVNMWTYREEKASYVMVMSSHSSYPDSITDNKLATYVYQWKVLGEVFINDRKFYGVRVTDVSNPATPTFLYNICLSNEHDQVLRIDPADVDWMPGTNKGFTRPGITADILFDCTTTLIDFAPGKLPSEKVTFSHTEPYNRQYNYFNTSRHLDQGIQKSDFFILNTGISKSEVITTNTEKIPGGFGPYRIESYRTTATLVSAFVQ